LEFDLIHRYFTRPFSGLLREHIPTVPVGIGDDCAVLQLPPAHRLYVSTDTLVSGVHFFDDEDPALVGWKALACNLSDLAASGADPLGFTLCLSLPSIDHGWLSAFSQGLLACAERYDCPLVGGDTTGAGLNRHATITLSVMGSAPAAHTGFHRGRALPGDAVWVSGLPGLARLGLLFEFQARGLLTQALRPEQLEPTLHVLAQVPEGLKHQAKQALTHPHPRLALATALRGVARAALDLSDGLFGDLAHVAEASGVQIQLDQCVIEQLWTQAWPELVQRSDQEVLLPVLSDISYTGGDDFELCWTADALHMKQYRASSHQLQTSHQIGQVVEGRGVVVCTADNTLLPIQAHSFNHFHDGGNP
jgi:thiamine-monophosphate kinase